MGVILDEYFDKSVIKSIWGNLFLYKLYYQRVRSQNLEGGLNIILSIT